MTYELCKQLKDAGFPQNSAQPEDCMEGDFDCNSCGSHFIYNPTLSELISACGNNFGSLIKASDDEDIWEAESVDLVIRIGFTPEEAVARLWLELNKK